METKEKTKTPIKATTKAKTKKNSEKFCFFTAVLSTKANPKPNGQPPKWLKHWSLVLFIEMLGTFLMVMLITAPSSIMKSGSPAHELFQYKIFLGFYVAFGIGVLVIMFGLVSANMNPAVTMVEIMSGHDTKKLGFGKILFQFLGAFAASFLVWHLAQEAGTFSETSTLGAPSATFFLEANNKIDMSDQMSWYWIPIFICEFFGTVILLWTVFGTRHKHLKDSVVKLAVYISIALFFVIWFNEMTSTQNLNPARLMAPALVTSWMGGSDRALEHSMVHLVPELMATFTYGVYMQQRNNVKIK